MALSANEEGGICKEYVYFAYALYHLPLQILYATEMFICQTIILANLGGHFVYDLYLSVIPFVLYYVIGGEEKLKKVDWYTDNSLLLVKLDDSIEPSLVK